MAPYRRFSQHFKEGKRHCLDDEDGVDLEAEAFLLEQLETMVDMYLDFV